jgi:glycosyltransferase involved in cell wall biosynthesis
MRALARYGRLVLERRLAKADALITNSEGTALKLRVFLGYNATAIVRPAVSGEFRPRQRTEVTSVLTRYGISQPYFLTVASADPHKNIELLITVFLAMKHEGLLARYTLVLGGKNGERLLNNFRRDAGQYAAGVKALGYVPGEDLPALYTGADVFILPSLDEGFGMPVLEARACHTKVVTSDVPELREAGGERAIYIRPDAEGIRSGILDALARERPAGPDDLWTWSSSAQILARAIDSA